MGRSDTAHEKATHRPERPPEIAKSKHIRSWDRVDEASWESFPASDPPAHWAGLDEKPPTLNGEEEEPEPANPEREKERPA